MGIVAVRGGAFEVAHRADEFWEKYDQGVWEPATVKVFETMLHPNSTHVDMGAWIGPTVLLAASLGATVVAYEPDPIAHGELVQNLAFNPELQSRTTVRRVAVATRAGEMRMLSNGPLLGDSGSSLVHRESAHRSATTVQTVDARTIHADPAFARCSFVKMDVEGSEYSIVPLMGPWFRQRKPALFLGLHGYPFFERYRWAPAPLDRQLRRLHVLAVRVRICWALRTHLHWYLPDDSWTVTNDSWAARPSGLHRAGLRERFMVLTKVREVDLLMTASPVAAFES